MNYSLKQKEYIDSVEGNAHQSAVRIIGELETELAEARKTPEPTEFTKECREYNFFDAEHPASERIIGIMRRLKEACVIIDRLTEDNEAKDKELAGLKTHKCEGCDTIIYYQSYCDRCNKLWES